MRVGFLVVLLVFAALASDSEAGFFRKVWRGIKKAVKKVLPYVRVGCSYSSGAGVRCGTGRIRRDAEKSDEVKMDAVCDDVVNDYPMLDQGISFTLLKDIFQEVDVEPEGGDDILSQTEYVDFIKALEMFNYCSRKAV